MWRKNWLYMSHYRISDQYRDKRACHIFKSKWLLSSILIDIVKKKWQELGLRAMKQSSLGDNLGLRNQCISRYKYISKSWKWVGNVAVNQVIGSGENIDKMAICI